MVDSFIGQPFLDVWKFVLGHIDFLVLCSLLMNVWFRIAHHVWVCVEYVYVGVGGEGLCLYLHCCLLTFLRSC